MNIVNIVSLWTVKSDVKLMNRMKKFNAETIKDGKQCLLVFASGKIIATGFDKLKNAKQFVKLNYPDAKLIKVVNMTAVAFIKRKINLKIKCISYEPEIYPAYIWKFENYPTVVYYTTGKLIITGGKSHKSMRQTFQVFKEMTSIKEAEAAKIDQLRNIIH